MPFLNFDKLKEFKATENSTIASVESTTTASKAYNIGDYFWYAGKLCKATAPIASGATITIGTNCSLAPLANDVSDLKSALVSTSKGDLGHPWIVFQEGMIAALADGSQKTNLNPTAYSGFVCAACSVTPGEIITIYGTGGGGDRRLYGWYDSSLVSLGRSNASLSGLFEVTAPANAAYIVININTSGGEYYAFKGTSIQGFINSATSAFYYATGFEPISSFLSKKGYDTTGTTVNVNSPTSNSSIDCKCVSCAEGDKFTYTGKGSSSYRPYAFLKSDGTILEKGDNHDWATVTITAPSNSAYVVFNMVNTGAYKVFKGIAKPMQPLLTFDNYPTNESDNPVKSGGVFKSIRRPFELINGISVITDFQAGYGYNTTGSTIDINNPTANSSIACAYAECTPGMQFTYTGKGSSSYKNYAFIDSSGNILEIGDSTYHTCKVITAPENAAYVVFNDNIGSGYITSYWKGAVTQLGVTNPGLFDFRGKHVAIVGDSISTNGDYSSSNPLGNVPEIVIQSEDVGVQLSAYVTWWDVYTNEGGTNLTNKSVGGHTFVDSEIGTEVSFTPVEGDIGKFVGVPRNNSASSVVTWWEVAQSVLGFFAIPVCWSGASITSHEGDTGILKTSYAWHPAQIRKCGIRTPGTMTRTAPDVVIIYRGTNDFSHSPYSKLTANYFSYPWTYPSTDEIDGGFGYEEGLCLTIRKLRETYPMAKIILCTCNFFKRVNYSSYPINNGQYTENQLNNAIREVASWMGCGLIEFDKDGLTFENASSTYYQDGTAYTHPTTAGHAIMGQRALRDLLNENNLT